LGWEEEERGEERLGEYVISIRSSPAREKARLGVDQRTHTYVRRVFHLTRACLVSISTIPPPIYILTTDT